MLILFNGKVGLRSLQTAIAIEDGKITAVGSNEEVLNLVRPDSIITNLEGKTIWQGLIDSHLHLETYAQALSLINCETPNRATCLERVAAQARILPSGTWLLGQGWNQNLWQNSFGTAAELDAVCGDHPAFLSDKSLHTAWVNSLAMRLTGIDKNTPDPDGGSLRRDSNGEPTGILFENAVHLVQQFIPQPSSTERLATLHNAQTQLVAMGLTAVTDFDPLSCYETLREMQLDHSLKLRVTKGIPLDRLDWAIAQNIHSGDGNGRLHWGPLKLFADGALGPQTAAMLQHYENNPSNFGKLQLTAADIFAIGRRAASHGISLASHAIGDAAVHEVVQGYSLLQQYEQQNSFPHLTHRIEHMQLATLDDLDRCVALGVVASVQPIHLTSDMFIADHHWGKRAMNSYAYHSMIDKGIPLICGSDAPVESPNPFWGIAAAVSRRRQDGKPGTDGWNGQERLTLSQALSAYSRTPACFSIDPRHSGQLTPGSYADLLILPQDPAEMESEKLFMIKPDRVMIGGEWVYPV